MNVKLPEDLSSVEEVRVVNDPKRTLLELCTRLERGIESPSNVLLGVPGDEGQVDGNRQPVAIDEEEEGQEPVDGGFRDDVRVQAVAKIDRVDVVAVVAISSVRWSRSRRHRGPA